MVRKFDFLVIGSGLAGMSFALKVAHKGTVALICKAGLEEANTYLHKEVSLPSPIWLWTTSRSTLRTP